LILTKKETSAREQTRARVLDLLARTEPPARAKSIQEGTQTFIARVD